MKGRILLTGGNGMVGKNIQEHIAAPEWDILAPSRQELDLTNQVDTLDYIKLHQPDIIIHAAGLVGGIQANIAAPVDFLVTNLEIGKNVVLAAKAAGITKLLNLGSSCMYPRNHNDALDEDLILTGELEPTNEGYALSKIFTQRLCQYIHQEDAHYHYKTLIPCNLYGRHDKFNPKQSHLIPAIIHKIHYAKQHDLKSVEIWGDGNARREFMYAGDLTNIIFNAINNFDALPTLMNVGLGFDFSINDYYQAAKEIIGWDGIFQHNLSKPVGMQRKLLNIAKQLDLGWKAKHSLTQGIRETYAYYLSTEVHHEISFS